MFSLQERAKLSSKLAVLLHIPTADECVWLCLYFKWFSCRQHLLDSCFFDPLCQSLLIGEFRPLMFKVIIDIALINIY